MENSGDILSATVRAEKPCHCDWAGNGLANPALTAHVPVTVGQLG
jgi:hypothetical protein